MATGAGIVAEALRWVDTPFHRNQRVRGVGTDCIGVVSGVAAALGIPHRYRSDYTLRPDGSMRVELESQLQRVTGPWQAGDVLMMALGSDEPHHVAIWTGDGRIVHAYGLVGRCVVQELAPVWRRRVVAVYRWPGVEA